MKEASTARAATWNNTIDAQRRAREEARQQRLAEREREAQLLDEAEAIHVEQERMKIIDRANQLMYQETDRVKTFNSAVARSDAVYLHDHQIEEKRARLRQLQQEEDEYHQQSEQRRLAELDKEHQASQRRKQRALELAELQRQQLDEHRRKLQRQQDLERDDGERAKRLLQLAVQGASFFAGILQFFGGSPLFFTDAQAESARHEELERARAREYMESNQMQKKMRELQRQRDQDEMDRIADYARRREAALEARRLAEAEQRAAKQSQINAMIDRQAQMLRQLRDDESSRLNRQIEVAEQRQAERLRSDEERRRLLLQSLDESRRQQMERKQREAAELAQIEQKQLEQWKARDQAAAQAERDAESKQRSLAKSLQATLKDQMVLSFSFLVCASLTVFCLCSFFGNINRTRRPSVCTRRSSRTSS